MTEESIKKIFENIRVYEFGFKSVPFDPDKIYNSLLKETGLNTIQVVWVTKKVIRMIFSLQLEYLTGPLIREIVCIVLLKSNLVKERFMYTRVGMPYYDFDILENGHKKDDRNIANRLRKEYNAVKEWIDVKLAK